MDAVLFPNQLFEPKILKICFPKVATIYFIEDPTFYGDRKGSPHASALDLNQLRILYMRMIHSKYIELLRKYFKVQVIPIEDLWNNVSYSFLPKKCRMIDPCDHLLMSRLKNTGIEWSIIDSPSFLLKRDDLAEYMKDREGKRLQHSSFYDFSKKKLKLLEDVKNQDIYNRSPYSETIPEPINPYRFNFSKIEEWNECLKWLQQSPFQNNQGPFKEWNIIIAEYLVHLPVKHEDVRKWLKDFIKNRFMNYGKYQDVVIPGKALLYHSGLSIFLNNGMLLPEDVIKAVKKYQDDITIQNYEGFLRQLIGWREYTRLYYLYVPSYIYRENTFGMIKRAFKKEWYQATTPIPVVNETIQDAFNYGYINHIQRLMVMSNFMTLNNVHPDYIFKWMYEFSLDSYDWVMVFNCYSMGSWSDNGFAMRKPYISSSNYILKMTNTGKGEWQEAWDTIYHEFIRRHKDVLKHTQLANLIISS